MADRHILAHRERLADIRMQHAHILNIATASDADGLGVTADHYAKPDTAIVSEFHVAHHLGAVGNPGRSRNAGCHTLKFINCHLASFCLYRISVQPRG